MHTYLHAPPPPPPPFFIYFPVLSSSSFLYFFCFLFSVFSGSFLPWAGVCGGISASSEHFSCEWTACKDTPAALCIQQIEDNILELHAPLLLVSTLFCLFASLMPWQYLAVVNVQPKSFHTLEKVLSLYITLSSPNLSTSNFFKSSAVCSLFSAIALSIKQ